MINKKLIYFIVGLIIFIIYLFYIYGRIPDTSYWYVKNLIILMKKLRGSINQIEFQEYSAEIYKLKKKMRKAKVFNKCKSLIKSQKLEKFMDYKYLRNKLAMMPY